MTNDKVLNTRISKKLYEKISDKAKRNRITVSNLIRNLVEDTLEIHEDIHDAIDKKVRKYFAEAEKHSVLGFQEITLAKDADCDNCTKKIKTGESAFFAFFEDDNSKALLCSDCKSRGWKSA